MKALALAAAGLGAAQVLPVLAGAGPVRRGLLPGLAGVGHDGHVALTFDDGPERASTPAFLRALDGLGWRATFFMLGDMVRADPGLAAEVAAAGHEVAVHGDRHRAQVLRGPWAISADLHAAVDAVSAATGRRPVWFRPPYGVLSGAGLLAARRQGLRTVLWTAWGRDWRAEATPASVVADVRRHLAPGATVLLHDSDSSSAAGAWRSALGALDGLAELFAAAGLEVGTLADHGVGRRHPSRHPSGDDRSLVFSP